MSGSEELQYAQQRHIPVPPVEAAHVTHANLWGRSIECTKPDDLWIEPPPGIYALTRPPQDCPGQPAYIEIEFERGVPVRANGIEMTLLEMIESLETIAGTHGVGRIDVIEQRVTGRPSRKLYEAPAAVVLHAAHRELEKLVIPRDLERLTHTLGRTYADLVYGGEWFSQTREAIDGLTAAIQPRVTGSVRLKLFKGDCQVVGRRSPFAPDDGDTSTLKVGETHDRAAAEGIQER
jgi:argininosuccinate synthase